MTSTSMTATLKSPITTTKSRTMPSEGFTGMITIINYKLVPEG